MQLRRGHAAHGGGGRSTADARPLATCQYPGIDALKSRPYAKSFAFALGPPLRGERRAVVAWSGRLRGQRYVKMSRCTDEAMRTLPPNHRRRPLFVPIRTPGASIRRGPALAPTLLPPLPSM